MEPLNLSNSTFTSKADRVYSDNGIFNPAGSNVKTLRGADEIVGNNFITLMPMGLIMKEILLQTKGVM